VNDLGRTKITGYIGDAASAAAQNAEDHVNNLLDAARDELGDGTVLTECEDCGEEINPKRVAFMRSKGMTCRRCVSCQEAYDNRPKTTIRMLDHVL
jgi:RNA polymerase-binding transcription factor DksA